MITLVPVIIALHVCHVSQSVPRNLFGLFFTDCGEFETSLIAFSVALQTKYPNSILFLHSSCGMVHS